VNISSIQMQDACAGLTDPKTEFNPLNILLN